jgi:hypothetical protein
MAVLSKQQAEELLRRQSGHLPVGLEARVDPPGLAKELSQLRALIRRHGKVAGSAKLRVTVNMAKAMDHLMGKNRKRSEPWVRRWERALRGGRWKDLPNQGFAFDWEGLFRDGQHRIEAIIRTGIEPDVWVAFGVDPEAFPVMDTGLRRNAAQNLALDGIKHAHPVSYVVRLKFRTENGGEMPDDGFVHEEGTRLMTQDDVMERAFAAGHKVRQEHKGVTLSSAVLAYWLIAQQSRRKLSVDEFFTGLYGEGAGFTEDHPIHRLRRKLKPLAKAGRKASQYLSQTQQAAWIILAWNTWIAGRSIPDSGPGSRSAFAWEKQHALPAVD